MVCDVGAGKFDEGSWRMMITRSTNRQTLRMGREGEERGKEGKDREGQGRTGREGRGGRGGRGGRVGGWVETS